MYDVLIVGAGLAGLECARLLARSGARVLIVDRKRSPEERVHTTGIFVRKTLEDFDLPSDCLGAAISRVALYSPYGASLQLQSEHDEEFRVGRMGNLYRYLLREATRWGAEWMPETSFVRSEEDGLWSLVELRSGTRRWMTRVRIIVGADGAVSRVAADLGLDENSEWIVGVENVYANLSLTGTRTMHCFVDPRIAPGYLAWAVEDGEEVHIGVGGYAERFAPVDALQTLEQKIVERFGVTLPLPRERRAGRIPVNGVLRRIANRRGLLLGDAAGAVSPLTAGGLDACLRLTKFGAKLIARSLSEGTPAALKLYDGHAFRPRFVSRLAMRRGYAALRSPLAVELAMRPLQLSPLTKFARHVFFGRGSFPDPELLLKKAAAR